MGVFVKIKLISLLSAFIIGSAGAASAAEESWESWLQDLNAVNPSVQVAHQQWKAAESMIAQSAPIPDPMIGLNVMRDSTRLDDYMDLEYMLEQDIPWPSGRRVDFERARLEAEAVGFEYLEVRRETKRQFMEAIWDLWLARQSVQTARDSLQWVESLDAVLTARLEAGQAEQVDALRVMMERDRLQNEVANRERSVPVALARLNALLNAPPDMPRSTDQMPRIPEFSASLEDLLIQARQYCCMLMAALWREQAAQLGLDSARLKQRPTLSLRVAARQPRDGNGIEEVDTGVAISIPWVWRGKYRGANAEARAAYERAAASLEEEVAMTLTDIQSLYAEVTSHQETMRLYAEQIVPRARVLAQSSSDSYGAGKGTMMEVIDAFRMTLDAEWTLHAEKAAYAKAHAALSAAADPWTEDEALTGLPVTHEGIQ